MNRTVKFIFYIIAVTGVWGCKQPKPQPEMRIPPTAAKDGINPYVAPDKSPMDMSYFPKDYPILRMNGTDEKSLVARVIYSRPQKKGRQIFGTSEKNLVQFGKEWRIGANEATEIEFFKNVKINGQPLPKGRYVMYGIPSPQNWMIAFNNNLFTWGLHMDSTQDVLRISEPVIEQKPPVEELTIFFEPSEIGADLFVIWDNVKVKIPISIEQ